jgi:pSer/pThr/pTyr-binding forkhead associated (FHA) protein
MVTKLIVASGKSAGRSISIKRNKLLIGRAEECDVRPLSDEVSRRHCAVIVGPADVWVEDLKSRNGTFVNGTRIEPATRTKLADGDLIRVGSLELKVFCRAPTAAGGAEEEVSRWLTADGDPAGSSDTTRNSPTDTGDGAADHHEETVVGRRPAEPAETEPEPEAAARSTTALSLEELKAAREAKEKPGSLPQSAAAKKADSSRDAAAEALKKFFDRK